MLSLENLGKIEKLPFWEPLKFKNQLVRNQVNYSPGTDQPKIRLARPQAKKYRGGKTFWRQCKYCIVEGGEFG